MTDVLAIVLIILLLLAALFLIPRWRMKRAARQVIKIFRKTQALNPQSARSIEELGLKPRGFIDGLMRGRDYKPYALNMMISSGVVLHTDDNRVYLSEDKLAATGFK